MGIAIREARAQSVTGSYHSVHNIPSSYAGTRIQPIQRYSSEGNEIFVTLTNYAKMSQFS